MSTWSDSEFNFDVIEWAAMAWLRSDIPNYLRFHEEGAGHLPQNFSFAGAVGTGEEDSRSKALNRIGYSSYSVFVNLATVRRAVDELPEQFHELLAVYDHVSRVALRLGAAIDSSLSLERDHRRLFDGTELHADKSAGTPAHKDLKTALDDEARLSAR